MEDIKERLEDLNRGWWLRGTEKSFILAKEWDEDHGPRIKVREWNKSSERYASFYLRIIGFIKVSEDKEALKKIVQDTIKIPELLDMLMKAFEEPKKTITLRQLRQLEHKAKLYPKYQNMLELVKKRSLEQRGKKRKLKEQLPLL